MLFNSVSYVLFLPICVLLYYLLPQKIRNLFLLIASYYFYMCWMPQYAMLIGFSTIVTWGSGYLLDKTHSPTGRKQVLIANIVLNLGILFVFKYFNFFMDTVTAITGVGQSARINLLLPVGISFYTFQALGYSVDVYRGEARGIKHEKNFLNYALFVSFFPQLVAGPIERSRNLLPQFREKHNFSIDNFVAGLRMILVGLYKKIVIADMMALVVDKIFSNYLELSGLSLLCGVFMFTIQIYCDFSGYSDVARGSAKIFGFRLMENFHAPYMSASIKEFWSRWHISLSTWLKDYLYIPLGGSRVSKCRKSINLIIVFLVSGIWHGANYTYIFWGLLHGGFRIIEDMIHNISNRTQQVCKSKLGNVFKVCVTFTIVMMCWTYFRAENLAQGNWFMLHYFKDIDVYLFWEEFVGIVKNVMPDIFNIWKVYIGIIGGSTILLAGCDWYYKYKQKNIPQLLSGLFWPVRWICYYSMIILIMFSFIMTTNQYGQAGAFLYFQF